MPPRRGHDPHGGRDSRALGHRLGRKEVSPVWRPGDGLLLLHGRVGAAADWAAKGLIPVHVGDLNGWTGVVPSGPSQAHPPYDDTLAVLVGRPVPGRLRPAIGMFAVDGRALVTVQPHGFRAMQRFVVWEPGTGVVQPPPLKPGKPSDLLKAAGVRSQTVQAQIRDILLDGESDATTVLCALAEALGLPGAALLRGRAEPDQMADHRLVEPKESRVRGFDTTAQADLQQRAELEDG